MDSSAPAVCLLLPYPVHSLVVVVSARASSLPSIVCAAWRYTYWYAEKWKSVPCTASCSLLKMKPYVVSLVYATTQKYQVHILARITTRKLARHHYYAADQ